MWRNARGAEDSTRSTTGHIDYAFTGEGYTRLLDRLENPSIDGAGLEPALQDDGEIYVAGVGKAGLDISSKNEPWRRCYHTCLMGAARAAEHLEGWVTDTTRFINFPANVVIGPSNPRPRPVPYQSAEAPLEENCVVAFGTPQSYYTKLLTTQGFTTRQRLDAALAYADWLSYKGLPESAEEMYDWGLDIAAGALPVEAHNVVDIKTGIINANANYISPNIIDATTSLAIHHARNKNFAAAFPIFLSVLRATRQLPSPPPQSPRDPFETGPPKDSGPLANIKSLFFEPPFPPAPPTGDEHLLRTPLAVCDEAGIMAHIGEIVFASALPTTNPASTRSMTTNKTSSQQNMNAGINWTRDAVETAESTFLGPAKRDREALKKCAQCINVGIRNWEKMVARMIKDAAPQQERPNQPEMGIDPSPTDTPARDNGGAGWNWGPIGWLWASFTHDKPGDGMLSGTGDAGADADAHDRWQREAKLVQERRAELRHMLRIEGLSDEDRAGTGVNPGDGWGLLFR
ncbi:hypothetical protein MMC07_007820 [Pseudocyphellaria aurata]|nr:hypothetical protein [Pseudocyphellaria aurata]